MLINYYAHRIQIFGTSDFWPDCVSITLVIAIYSIHFYDEGTDLNFSSFDQKKNNNIN